MAQEVHVFAPATVANVACGFDTMGFALNRPGDEIIATFSQTSGITISIEGDHGKLPTIPEKNTAGVAALALLEKLGETRGIHLHIIKGIPIGSGLGSSACSAVAAAFAVNELLGRPLTRKELLPFALAGEAIASGGAIHADNVGPCLLGGMVLVRSNKENDTVNIPTPNNLFAVAVLPDLQILTSEARAILRDEIPMKDAINQWGNLGGLVAGLMKSDYQLIGRSLVDVVAEPYRSRLIPGFETVKQAAMNTGALGCSISGAGPSVFALCEGDATAFQVASVMEAAFAQHGIKSTRYVSTINQKGTERFR
ncbi:homoserine kinase [Pontibacter sp. G13]|uniref:homoserine kinase n=1 Tax=Pontibacter sp. G13 TaxID=3074898 RepID=UPI00288992A7|nr:homoserine kinase [Pontibacter sp. G13]WNJ18938.1 homoserine kinase [Pontibacter sp. G13]